MNEQILVKSKSIKFKWIMIVFGIIAALTFLSIIVPTIVECVEESQYYNENIDFADKAYKPNHKGDYSGLIYENEKPTRVTMSEYDVKRLVLADSCMEYAMKESNFWEMFSVGLICSVLAIVAGLVTWVLLYFTTLTVTDKRVYYKFLFFVYAVVPIDAITSSAAFFPLGVYVGSSSHKIFICLILNSREIHETIIKQMIERQGKDNADKKCLSPETV